VVDNLPADVAPDKFDKLCEKVYPRFEAAGIVARNPDGDTPRILIARDDDGKTLGYAFVEYISPEEAHKAVDALHNSALSKKHVFWVDTAGALEKLQDVPEEFVVPADLTQAVEARHDIKSWLLDSRGRDMFLIRHDKETAVWWNDHITKPQLVRSDCSLFHSYRSQTLPTSGCDGYPDGRKFKRHFSSGATRAQWDCIPGVVLKNRIRGCI
jgi:translation initiation factor 3 subunit B